MKAIIVGAGLSGVVSAIILKEKGYNVEIFEQRNHIAGNCYDKKIEGIMVHKYGPHGFHTNNKMVWDFVNKYTDFNNTCLKVKANTKDGIIPIPYGPAAKEIIGEKTSEEIINLIFKDYSEKMWGVPWEKLPPSITKRVPKIRNNLSTCFHVDKYQGIPVSGYTVMFKNMLDGIKVHLNCKKDEWRKQKYDLLIYTGKIDEYFDYCHGWLEYRSLFIQFETGVRRPDIFQLNECNKKAWTRSVDHSHWHTQNVTNTIISKEYPQEHTPHNIPFYPKQFGKNTELYKEYKKLADRQKNVIFTGRLATYKYLDMDIAIAQALQKLSQV